MKVSFDAICNFKIFLTMFKLFSEPQEDNPKITFNRDSYEIGDILEANCTTSPAKPPPHITWLINKEKVTKHFVL